MYFFQNKTSSRKYYYYRRPNKERPIGDPSETDIHDRRPRHASSEGRGTGVLGWDWGAVPLWACPPLGLAPLSRLY